jgi:sulfofructosephosphate aldolase
MVTPNVTRRTVNTGIARPNGTFAMLANDQRETLRTLLAEAGKDATDDGLRNFKREVARHISPAASAMLVDRVYGLDSVSVPNVLAPDCGLIVAVDNLVQPPGGIVESTTLDVEAMGLELVQAGAKALKFLVIWRTDDGGGRRDEMLPAFVQGCHRLGLAAVAEAIVRAPGDEDALDEAILRAAEEMGSYGPDVYKAQVPTLGKGSPEKIERLSRELTDAVGCPWVVLSSGVPQERFATAVEAACRGGASGFLAGRGIWAASIAAGNTIDDLKQAAINRFEHLVSIVDACGRPWFEATRT